MAIPLTPPVLFLISSLIFSSHLISSRLFSSHT